MATRLYFTITSSGLTITPSATWTKILSTAFETYGCTLAEKVHTWDSGEDMDGGSENPQTVILAQVATQKWGAYDWTTSDTIKIQVKGYETNADLDGKLHAVIRVVAGDSPHTVRGVLYDGTSDTELIVDTYTNRSLTSAGAVAVQNNVSMQNGDRVVIELGYKSTVTPGGFRSVYLRFSENYDSDLPENQTSTDSLDPWIEFSPTLPDEGEGGAGNVNTMVMIFES